MFISGAYVYLLFCRWKHRRRKRRIRGNYDSMIRVRKTDFEHLELYLNDLISNGCEIVQILPSVEYDTTLCVVVYKEQQNEREKDLR